MKIITNAREIAKKYKLRAALYELGLFRGLRKAAAEIDEKSVQLLSGSNAAQPGTYPVPNRRGNLMAGHFFEVPQFNMAVVGNTSDHAVAVHQGEGSSSPYGRRPFLENAGELTDVGGLVAGEIRRTALAI